MGSQHGFLRRVTRALVGAEDHRRDAQRSALVTAHELPVRLQVAAAGPLDQDCVLLLDVVSPTSRTPVSERGSR